MIIVALEDWSIQTDLQVSGEMKRCLQNIVDLVQSPTSDLA